MTTAKTCATCGAFDMLAVDSETDAPTGGYCRRHAPLHLGEEVPLDRGDPQARFVRSVWPSVRASDWCLEHTSNAPGQQTG